MSDIPVDPKLGRFAPVIRALHVATLVVGLAAVVAIIGGPIDRVASLVMLTVLVAAPLLRVCWFIARWLRRGDPRFALVGCGVLVVVAVGVILSH